MPERDFIGKCTDCELETPIPLKLKWSGGPAWRKADRNSPLVEWIIHHHAHAIRGVCSEIEIISDGISVGYIVVIRHEEFYRSQNEKDCSIAVFSIFESKLK